MTALLSLPLCKHSFFSHHNYTSLTQQQVIEIKFTRVKYTVDGLSIFRKLCKHHQDVSLNTVFAIKRNLEPISVTPHHAPSPTSSPRPRQLLISLHFPILDISYKLSGIICVLSHRPLFINMTVKVLKSVLHSFFL